MDQRKKRNFRKIVNTLHLWLGLPSGLILFIVALTGALYVFEEEGRQLFQHDYYHVQNAGTERLSLKQMTDSFTRHYPKEKISSIRFTDEKDAAFIFISKKDLSVSINPYTAEINGVKNLNRDFFSVVREIHTHLLLGKVGNEIIRWNVLVFFILCVSGLILWWPRQKRFFKQAATIKFKTQNRKRVNWDLHSVLGFYALLVLLIISLTGLFWMFDTAKNIVGFITHSPVPVKEEKVRSSRISMNEAVTKNNMVTTKSDTIMGNGSIMKRRTGIKGQAVSLVDEKGKSSVPGHIVINAPLKTEKHNDGIKGQDEIKVNDSMKEYIVADGYDRKKAHAGMKRYKLDSVYNYMSAVYPGAKETFITPPADSLAPIRIIMRYPYTIVRKQNTLYFDRYSGKILKAELYANYTGYDKVAKSNYDFHTGKILGLGSKIIYFLAALMAASLPITGFLIWWGKKKKISYRK